MNLDIGSPEVETELVFWSRQLSEHALFLYFGLELQPYKDYSMKLHRKWERFRSVHGSVDKFNSLARRLKKFQISLLDEDRPLGRINSGFVIHFNRELNFAAAKVNKKKISSWNEAQFWKMTNKDHAIRATDQLNSTDEELVKTAYCLAERIASCTDPESQLYREFSLHHRNAMDRYSCPLVPVEGPQSPIHPMLLSHLIRESRRSIAALRKMKCGK